MILIVSRDEDFSAVLAKQLKAELGLAYHISDSAAPLPEGLRLIVSSEEIKEKMPVPVIAAVPPVRLPALLSAIQSALQSVSDEVFSHGAYQFSLRTKQLLHTTTGQAASLTDKEAQLLAELVKAGKKGLGRDALLKQVWGMVSDVDTHTLETHIYRLREKFRELGEENAIAATDGGYTLGIK